MSAPILRFNGGLGNQIFQYAFYLFCEKYNIYLDADKSVYEAEKIHGGFLLDRLFPENHIRYTKIDTSVYCKPYTFKERIKNKLSHHVNNHYYEEYFATTNDIIPFLKKRGFCYLEGWWQDIEYTKVCLDTLRRLKISITDYPDNCVQELLRNILAQTSISVHVRRGDYLKSRSAQAHYGNICTVAYYRNAIKYIKERYSGLRFFIFSDDEEFCREAFKGDEYYIVSSSPPEKAYIDLLLMSKCDHHIIANSSYSWWGTMLADSLGTVIMPIAWDNLANRNKLLIPDAVYMDNKGTVVL